MARALLIFAACLNYQTASALDVNIGNLSGTSYALGQTYASGTSFSDTIHFNLAGESNSFNAVASQLTLLNFFNITNFSLTLTQPTGPASTFTAAADGSIVTGVHTLLPGIDYVATLSGLVNGTLGGGYTVLLAAVPFEVAAIPEPSSSALLLAGIALVTLVRRRRGAR